MSVVTAASTWSSVNCFGWNSWTLIRTHVSGLRYFVLYDINSCLLSRLHQLDQVLTVLGESFGHWSEHIKFLLQLHSFEMQPCSIWKSLKQRRWCIVKHAYDYLSWGCTLYHLFLSLLVYKILWYFVSIDHIVNTVGIRRGKKVIKKIKIKYKKSIIIYALHPTCPKLPQRYLWNRSSVCWIDSGPFTSFTYTRTLSHSEHRFPAPSLKEGCRKPMLEFGTLSVCPLSFMHALSLSLSFEGRSPSASLDLIY